MLHGYFSYFCCHLLTFSQNKLSGTLSARVFDCLDLDQEWQNVSPDLGLNCKGYQQATKFTASKERVNSIFRKFCA